MAPWSSLIILLVNYMYIDLSAFENLVTIINFYSVFNFYNMPRFCLVATGIYAVGLVCSSQLIERHLRKLYQLPKMLSFCSITFAKLQLTCIRDVIL